MDDRNTDLVLARLDRLSEQFVQRLERLEQKLRGLERDNGEIISLLIAMKAGLEEAPGDLLARIEELQGVAPAPDDDSGDDDSGDDDSGDDGPDSAGSDGTGSEGAPWGRPSGPMLH